MTVAALSPTAFGAQGVISVQFQDTSNGANNVVTGTAGAVAVANWNTGVGPNGTSQVLHDSTGTTTAATVTWNSNNTWSNGSTNSGGNDSLLRGYLDDSNNNGGAVGDVPLVTVSNIPYATYDVIVYSHGDAGFNSNQGKYFVDSVSHATTDTTNFQMCSNTNFDSQLLPSTNGGLGNYMIFRGLTGPTLVISPRRLGANNATPRAPLCGFQIIAPSLPGTTRDISVSFLGRQGSNVMAANEIAGVVPRQNWQDAEGQNSAAALALNDESGNSTGASVTWTAQDFWSNQGTADSSGDYRMMRGYITGNGDGTHAQFVLTGLPSYFATYDVYIYTDTDTQPNAGSYALSVASPASSVNWTNTTNNAIFAATGVYTQSVGGGNGDYIKFTGVSGSAVTITTTVAAGGNRAGFDGFQIIRTPPSIASIAPPNAFFQSTTTSVTIMGASFSASGVSFTFGGIPATNLVYNSPTSYTVTVPAQTAGGAVNVVYSNGVDSTTLTNGFTYTSSLPPTITSVTLTPSGAAVGPTGGGTNITLTGTNFEAGDIVTIGGTNGYTAVNANNVVVVSPTTITCTTHAASPAGAVGSTRVSVTDPSNNNALAFLENAFEYTAAAPTITSISPATGQYNVSTNVTITGTGFAPNFTTDGTVPGTITCGGQTLLNIAFVSSTQLTGTIQPMSATMTSRNQDVVVTNSDGNASAINAGDVFTYILRDPENDTGLQPAVIYRYYNNNTFNDVLPLNSFPLAVDAFNKIGTTNSLIVPPQTNPIAGDTTNFAIDYVGMLNVPTDGVWMFSTPSDDSTLLYIGTTLVVNNSVAGGHGAPGNTPNGSIGLKAGFHRFRVQYCQGGGGYQLNVLWSGPGVSQINIPVGTADFTGAGFYCDAQPSILSVDTQAGALAGGTIVNTITTGGSANYTTPTTFPGTNPAGSSTLTSVSFQTIPLTRVASNPSAGQFAITSQTSVQINTPAGLFAGGAPIVLTTLNGLSAVLQPSGGGFAYTANSGNYRTPENPASTVPGVNVKFLRTNGTSGTIPGIGADLVPSGGFLTGNGVTELDSYNPVKGLSLNPNAAPTADNFATNIMTGPLAGGAANGTLLSFAQDTLNFYMKATGYIKITTPGLYTFTTSSDDNSRVFFGSTELLTDIYPIGNAGFGVTSVSNTINLGAGVHKFTVLYGQGTGGYGFSLQYSGPDNGNTLGFVPDGVLFTDAAPPAFAATSPLTPAGGSSLGNTSVTATGTNFVSGAQVFVNGLPATHVAVNSNGTIVTFITPASTVGQVANVVIVNPNGMSDTVVNGFTYDNTGRPPDLATGAPQAVPGCYFRYYEGNENGLANGLNYATIGTPFRVGAKTTAEYVPENTINYPTRRFNQWQ